MTLKDQFFTRPEVFRIIGWAGVSKHEFIEIPPPCIRKPMQLWTGKQIISVVFSPNKFSKVKLNLRAKGKNYSGAAEEMNPEDTCKQ